MVPVLCVLTENQTGSPSSRWRSLSSPSEEQERDAPSSPPRAAWKTWPTALNLHQTHTHLSMVRPHTSPLSHTHIHTQTQADWFSQRYAHMLNPSSKATGMHTNHLMTTKCGPHWYSSLLLRCLPVECQDFLRPAFSANQMLKGKDSRGFILFLCTLTVECIYWQRVRGNSLQTFSKPRLKLPTCIHVMLFSLRHTISVPI